MFEPNEYFTNETLTKQYLMKFSLDEESPLEYDGPEIFKCKGYVWSRSLPPVVTRFSQSTQLHYIEPG